MGDQTAMTERPLGRTPANMALVCAVALLSLLFTAATAAAADYCVGPADSTECPVSATHPAGSPGSTTQLLNAMVVATNNDRIFVHSGTYSAGNFNFSGNNLEVRGVGATRPIFTIPDGSASDNLKVVSNSGVLAKFTNIAVELPDDAINVTGIYVPGGGVRVDGVTITSRGGSGATGVEIGQSNPDLLNANISLPTDSGVGVKVLGGSTTVKITGISVTAYTAIQATNSQELRIHRATLRAPRGLSLVDSPGTVIASSLFLPAPDDESYVGRFAVRSVDGAGHIGAAPTKVYNATIIGRGDAGSVAFQAFTSGPNSRAQIDVDSSLIVAFDQISEISDAYTGDIASVNLAYSPDFDSTSEVAFSSPVDGDYSLLRSSSLVDAGNPGALTNESSTDLAGNTRIVSRGAGNRRDIGAYEVQNAAPVARIAVVTAVPSSTSPVAFSGAGSTDADGDALTYSWRFDSTAFASGVEVSRNFPLVGPHTVELTVADSTGVASTVTSQFEVAKGFLPLTLRSRNVRADKRGRFSITMTCPDRATSNCTGRMIFETTKKIEAKNYQDPPRRSRSSKAKILRAANYVFSVEPGTTRKLTINTYGTFQNVLKKHKKFKLVAKVVSGSTNNAVLTANRPTFTLSAPKR